MRQKTINAPPKTFRDMYSTYDNDGYPFIPNGDGYLSKDLKYVGLAEQNKATAQIEFLLTSNEPSEDLEVLDIYETLYENIHKDCWDSCVGTSIGHGNEHISSDRKGYNKNMICEK